jgi:hypothetical protein
VISPQTSAKHVESQLVFRFSPRIIGIIFIKWTAFDFGGILLAVEIVPAFKQAGNIASSINSISKANYPYDYEYIQSLLSA